MVDNNIIDVSESSAKKLKEYKMFIYPIYPSSDSSMNDQIVFGVLNYIRCCSFHQHLSCIIHVKYLLTN